MGLFIANGTGSLTPPQVISNEVLSRHNVYGVVFDGISSKGKPLYNAIDQKWIPATINDPGVDTWKDIAPFNVKKCITDYDATDPTKRKVLAYDGDTNYNSLKTDKIGDRMVEFPLGYYYRPDPWTFIVSPDPIDGFKPSPACDLGNGTILSGFRLSEFDLCNVSSVLRSIPGYSPLIDTDEQIFKNSLKANGQYLETFGAWCWINILRLIKQQNLNSQKVNGMGIHSGNFSSANVIIEDNIQGLDGYIGITANDNVRTLGLQNFYGNIWNFLDNVIVRSNGKVWIKKDFTNTDNYPTYSDTVPNGWEELDVVLPTANKNLMSEIAWNSSNPWALYPSKLGGSDVEPIGDVCWNILNEPFSVVVVGGTSWEGSFGGALCWFSHYSLSSVNVRFCVHSLEIVL